MQILTSSDALVLWAFTGAAMGVGVAAYLVHCQRRHVARKTARRRR